MNDKFNVGKLTKQRKIIIDILKEQKEPFTINDIILKIKEKEGIDMVFSTIFRNLEILSNKYIVRKTTISNGEVVYTINEDIEQVHHNHVLKCKNCNKKIVIDKCPFVFLKDSLEKETGFRLDTEMNIEIEGYCNECKDKKKQK